MATKGFMSGGSNSNVANSGYQAHSTDNAHSLQTLSPRPGGISPTLADYFLQVAGRAAEFEAMLQSPEKIAAVASVDSRDLVATLQVALADHDAIMSADFAFGEACNASPADFLAILDMDLDDDDAEDVAVADTEATHATNHRTFSHSPLPESGPERLRALSAHLDTCAFCRWRARLAWMSQVPADERDLTEELERLIVEPAVTWRELELEWAEAATVGHAATAVATAAPTIVCLDGRTAQKIAVDQVSEPKWRSHGNGRGHLSLSLFGLPTHYTRYRLILFAGHHLRRMLDLSQAGEPDDLQLPSLDLIDRHAPDLLQKLLPTHGLPPMALPQFNGSLSPYGDKCSLTWTSPPIGQVRLRGDDIILACLY